MPTLEEPEVSMDEPEVRNWFDCKRDGGVLLRVQVYNKGSGKVKAYIKIEHQCEQGQIANVQVPKSEVIETFFKNGDSKVILHL